MRAEVEAEMELVNLCIFFQGWWLEEGRKYRGAPTWTCSFLEFSKLEGKQFGLALGLVFFWTWPVFNQGGFGLF